MNSSISLVIKFYICTEDLVATIMKVLHLALFIISTNLAGHASCFDIVESIVTTLLTDCSSIKQALNSTYEQMDNSTSEPSASNVTLWLYGDNILNRTSISLNGSGNALLNNPYFNPELSTEFVIHGFFQNSQSYELNVILGSLITHGRRNVILVDSQKIIGWWYFYSSTAVRFIGEYFGNELATLVGNGYNKSKIHMIGFSLGAHIAGFAGKTFKSKTQGSLPWITGLDPAGPCFFKSSAVERLDKADADFVDVIHTNMGVWGTTMEIGHVDFYPNSGDNQPDIILPVFSHYFALHLYAESVLNKNSFPSVNCKGWLLFLFGGCSWNSKTNMGFGVSKVATGRYYLSTNGNIPYNKGCAGIPIFNFFAWIAGVFM